MRKQEPRFFWPCISCGEMKEGRDNQRSLKGGLSCQNSFVWRSIIIHQLNNSFSIFVNCGKTLSLDNKIWTQSKINWDIRCCHTRMMLYFWYVHQYAAGLDSTYSEVDGVHWLALLAVAVIQHSEDNNPHMTIYGYFCLCYIISCRLLAHKAR